MIARKIISELEKIASPELARFDYKGIIVGDDKKNVTKIGISLDFSLKTINEAIKRKCDMLIVHHAPKIFDNISGLEKEKLKVVLSNDILVYRMHLNLDFTKNGIIDNLCKLMGFYAKPVETIYQVIKIFGGVYLTEEELTLEEILSKVKKINPKSIRLAGVKKEKYNKIAISSGSGFKPEFLDQLRPDAFIAGNLDQEAIKTAEDLNITLIEATHYSTENKPLELFSRKLKNILLVDVEFIDVGDSLEVIK
jgi:dinuclear metal center YbgI/SA1388 family protein